MNMFASAWNIKFRFCWWKTAILYKTRTQFIWINTDHVLNGKYKIWSFFFCCHRTKWLLVPCCCSSACSCIYLFVCCWFFSCWRSWLSTIIMYVNINIVPEISFFPENYCLKYSMRTKRNHFFPKEFSMKYTTNRNNLKTGSRKKMCCSFVDVFLSRISISFSSHLKSA